MIEYCLTTDSSAGLQQDIVPLRYVVSSFEVGLS
jgi:hypothetical protein